MTRAFKVLISKVVYILLERSHFSSKSSPLQVLNSSNMDFLPTSPLSILGLSLVVLLVFYLATVNSSTIRSVGIQAGPFNLRRRAARQDWVNNGYLRIQEAYNNVELLCRVWTTLD